MRSALPKVLHAIAGRSMLGHVLAIAARPGAPRSPWSWRRAWRRCAPRPRRRRPASRCSSRRRKPAPPTPCSPPARRRSPQAAIRSCCSPTRRWSSPTRCGAWSETLEAGAQVAVLGFEPADPTGYGRLICGDGGRVEAIREERDATEASAEIGLCNAGAMGFRVPDLAGLLGRIANRNAKSEYYLTDAVAVAAADGLVPRPVVHARGGDGRQLARAAGGRPRPFSRQRARRRAMERGRHAGCARYGVAELRHA